MSKQLKRPKWPLPCYYKKSCGYEICMHEDCPEYKPKKRGEKFLGDEQEADKNDICR